MVCLMALFAASTKAQNGNSTEKNWFNSKLMVELEASSGLKQHGIQPIIGATNIGWRILPQLSVYARWQGMKGLYDLNGNRTYFNAQNLGGGLEYTFARESFGNGSVLFGARAQMTAGIGSPEWKNTTYDLGLTMHLQPKCGKTNIYFGLGFRHINSHTTGLRDLNGIYGTIGFGI